MKTKARIIFVLFVILYQYVELSAISRHPVRGKNGMVVTSHELASQIGIDILKSGGNAVDAAVAVGFALAVIHPSAGNLGGGGFMVIHFPDGRATTIDFREKAPLKASRNMYLDDQGEVITGLSTTGYLASGVPGSVAGLTMALEKYGTMNLKKVMAPALRLAKHGFLVRYNFHKDIDRLKYLFRQFPSSAKIFLHADGNPYREGELFKQPDLGRTLALIAAKGASVFYQGEIAELIVNDMALHGGIISRDDLAEYQAIERLPVRGSYHNFQTISMGPPSSGGIAVIQALNILEGFDLLSLGYNSSDYLHVMAETFKQIFCDRAEYLGDSDFEKVPVTELLSKAYAKTLRLRIQPLMATPALQISPGLLTSYEGDHTTHYSVIDKDQLMVAVTTTLNSSYGSKVVVEGAGFLMNNEMDDFAVNPGLPNLYGLISHEVNSIEPGKRMLSSMAPTVITKDREIVMSVGAMGGAAIITSVIQVMVNVFDFRMNIQEAVSAPRIHHQWLPDSINYEKFALSRDTVERLTSFGHRVSEINSSLAEAHVILIDKKQGVYLGAADPRFEGKAIGY